MSLVALPGGDLLVAAADPWLGRLGADGRPRWVHRSPNTDFRNHRYTLAVSSDGTRVDFGFQPFGKVPARFDVEALTLTRDPPSGGGMARPRQVGLPVAGWANGDHPTLDGRPLARDLYETPRSLAIRPAGDRFVLGTEWSLRAFDKNGRSLWNRPSPSIAWAVNITGDGRLVVAAYGDGTIRWHRMTDGAELLAFMPLPDETNWVAWTPEGFYAATEGARGILRWHVNHG